jgi:SAM-dependent methyltransferase
MMEHTYPILFRVEQSHWWYIGRRKILAGFVEEICRHVTDRRPRILDVGCGTGANLLMLSKYGDAEGVDVSEDALAFCRERGLDRVKLGAAEALPYDDGTFDLVTAFDVVEHMDDDLAGCVRCDACCGPVDECCCLCRRSCFCGACRMTSAITAVAIVYRNSARARGRWLRDRAHDVREYHVLLPILVVRKLMRLTGIKAESENNITVSALNGVLGRVFGAESWILRYMNCRLVCRGCV